MKHITFFLACILFCARALAQNGIAAPTYSLKYAKEDSESTIAYSKDSQRSSMHIKIGPVETWFILNDHQYTAIHTGEDLMQSAYMYGRAENGIMEDYVYLPIDYLDQPMVTFSGKPAVGTNEVSVRNLGSPTNDGAPEMLKGTMEISKLGRWDTLTVLMRNGNPLTTVKYKDWKPFGQSELPQAIEVTDVSRHKTAKYTLVEAKLTADIPDTATLIAHDTLVTDNRDPEKPLSFKYDSSQGALQSQLIKKKALMTKVEAQVGKSYIPYYILGAIILTLTVGGSIFVTRRKKR